MAISKINTRALANDSVTTDKVADNAITTDMVASGEIGVTDLADGSITNAKVSTTAAIAASKVDLSSIAGNVDLASGALQIGGNTVINSSRQAFFTAATGSSLKLERSDVGHGMTAIAETATFGHLTAEGGANGGLRITALADTASTSAFNVSAYAHTPSTDGNAAVIRLRGSKKNGTGEQAIADSEDLLSIGNVGTERIIVKGNGDFQVNGTTVINSSQVGFLNEKTRIGTGATYPTDNAQLFIQRANNNPYIGFFSNDGSRNAYLQSVGSGAFYLNNAEGGGWAFNNSTSDVLTISDSGALTTGGPLTVPANSHVLFGSTSTAQWSATTGAGGVNIRGGSNGSYLALANESATGYSNIYLNKINVTSDITNNLNRFLDFYYDGVSGVRVRGNSSKDLSVDMHGGGKFSILGNVGIGDTGPTSVLSIQKNSTRTTDFENMLKITHTSSGTTGVGFGSAIYFVGERNNGVNQAMGRLVFDAEVNSGTNISSGFSVQTATNGSTSEKFRITNDGSLKAQNNSGNLALGLLSGSGDIYLGGGAVQPSDIHLQTTGGIGVQITANKETFAKGPVYLNSGTNGTTDALTFKTTDNGDNSKYIRMNAYWMEHSGNANEGMYFHAGEELLRLRGSTNTTPKRVDVVASNGMYVKDGLPYYHDKRGTVTTDSNGYAEVGLASWSWGTYYTFKRSALLMISFRNDTNEDQHTAFGLQTVVYFHNISQHHTVSTNQGSSASIDLQANGSTGQRKIRIHNARASATLDYIIKALPIADEHWTGSGI